jgi:hypothetical protein
MVRAPSRKSGLFTANYSIRLSKNHLIIPSVNVGIFPKNKKTGREKSRPVSDV